MSEEMAYSSKEMAKQTYTMAIRGEAMAKWMKKINGSKDQKF
jgi:hypothetical protein